MKRLPLNVLLQRRSHIDVGRWRSVATRDAWVSGAARYASTRAWTSAVALDCSAGCLFAVPVLLGHRLGALLRPWCREAQCRWSPKVKKKRYSNFCGSLSKHTHGLAMSGATRG